MATRRAEEHRRLAVLVASATALLGTGCGPAAAPPAADWPHFDSLSRLRAAADVVVEGRLLSTSRQRIAVALASASERDGREPAAVISYTAHELEVERVVGGDRTIGDTVWVGQPSDVGSARMVVGGTYLLFAELSRDDLPLSLISPVHGVYRSVGGGAFEPVHHANPLRFGEDDLAALG
ncbi:hypothetical protein [Actinoalloteichus spitiensis]|uniref:hypothetical protein n=1 Tax=Actinoalloteichus spitiensis TaxID=252394 RepID=UPI00037D2AF2|nr:hypothetical protein [Actinoalloteichus spitiensis]